MLARMVAVAAAVLSCAAVASAQSEPASDPVPPPPAAEPLDIVPAPRPADPRPPGTRRVRLDVGELTAYLVPEHIHPRHNIHPALLEVLCEGGFCDRWLDEDVRLAVRRPDAPRARGPIDLPNGPGTAVLRAYRPRARRIGGAVAMVGLLGNAAVLLTYGIGLRNVPMTTAGAIVGVIGLGLGLGFIFGAGSPELQWTPGVPL